MDMSQNKKVVQGFKNIYMHFELVPFPENVSSQCRLEEMQNCIINFLLNCLV